MEETEVITDKTGKNPESTKAKSSEDLVKEVCKKIKKEEISDGQDIVVKKRRMEVEFNLFSIQFEPRKRRSVQRYVDTQGPSRMRKQNKDNNENQEEDSTTDVSCDLCFQKYDSVKSLKLHMQGKHSRPAKYTCALCSETFETNQHLITHKHIHKDEERTFLCMECKSAFSDHLAFLKHQAYHKTNNHVCIECGKRFDNSLTHVQHIPSHCDNLVKCKICHVERKPGSMRGHIQQVHASNGKMKCVECFKMINVKYMEYHMSSHTGVKPYQCLYCGKGFPHRAHRNTHTATHSHERRFECDICKFKFKTENDLKRHLKVHMANKFTCHICGRSYKSQKFLNYHMDVHNNTEKYTCKFCGKKFNNTTSLRSHIERNHMDIRKYKCVPCSTAFKTIQDLTRHTKKSIKHKNNIYRLQKSKEKSGED